MSADRTRELEERVRALTQENARLLAAQGDSLVLGSIAEHLSKLDETDAIVRSGLEWIGNMREVPICALCEEVEGGIVVISSHLSRTGDTIDGRFLPTTPRVVAQVAHGPVLLVGKECAEAGLPSDGPLAAFRPSGVLLVPFRARHVPRGIALFADDRPERETVDAVDVLTRAAELLRVRLDTVALLFELKLLNAELDLKVADRTRALSASQERLRIAIDAASLATWEWDVEAREVEWSGVAGLLGSEELAGTIEAYLERVHAEDRAAVAATFARARETADPQRIEHRVPRGEGMRWLELHARAAAAQPGSPRRVAGVVLDVTDRRMLEDELRQAQKMESVGRLAGGIAHDFNNLLTTILGTSEMVLESLPPHHPLRTDIAAVRDAGKRAATLTKQLLAFSRKQRLETRPEDLAAIVRGFTPMLSRLIGGDITVRLELEVTLPPVLADRTQLEQILLNLAVNARDAMPRGGTLTFSASLALALPGQEGPRYVQLSVADTGQGMSPEVAARAFDPFFTTKPSGKGTGLGLATVYGIVRQHLGTISLRTVPGKGTRFDVLLPVAEAAVAAPAAETAPERSPLGKGETVLVVDDEELVRTAVVRSLQARNYTVLEAASAAEALGILDRAADRIQLLLSDVIMPGGRGTELARVFQERYPGKPVLLMSGYLEPDEHGAPADVQVLEKPLAPSQLARAVRAALDGKPVETGA
jgi:two-component system cell cycle sensor histidine kinase/response regulator CckA